MSESVKIYYRDTTGNKKNLELRVSNNDYGRGILDVTLWEGSTGKGYGSLIDSIKAFIKDCHSVESVSYTEHTETKLPIQIKKE